MTCLKGKNPRLLFNGTGNGPTNSLRLVHSNFCSPIEIKSGDGYMLNFINDYLHKTFVYFIRSKEEVVSKFEEFKNDVEIETGESIRRNNGSEYCNTKLRKLLYKVVQKGIHHQGTVPYTPQQNDKKNERMNRTIIKKTRCFADRLKFTKKLLSGSSQHCSLFLKQNCMRSG